MLPVQHSWSRKRWHRFLDCNQILLCFPPCLPDTSHCCRPLGELKRFHLPPRSTHNFYPISKSSKAPPPSSSVFPILTSLVESPPAGDPAEQVRLQLVGGRRQAGGSSVSSHLQGGGPVQLQQGQVVVVGVIVIVLMKVDALNSCHLFSRAAAVQQEFTQIDSPRRGRVETAGEKSFLSWLLCICSSSFPLLPTDLLFVSEQNHPHPLKFKHSLFAARALNHHTNSIKTEELLILYRMLQLYFWAVIQPASDSGF